MLFNKNDNRANEQILYKTKPNMILGCKKAIYGVILLAVVLSISPIIIQFISQMQVYLISYVKLSLTRYTAIAFFVVILIIIIYIIWQLIGWYATEYVLTDSKIIVKNGVLYTKKNYMPYATIQDINTSQSIIARLFNVGSISVYSAYDNNQMMLNNISNPGEVENIIFDMISNRNFQSNPSRFVNQQNFEYYDDYEAITPITRENRNNEYYYENDDFNSQSPRQYEYEPYDDNIERNIDKALNNMDSDIKYEGSSNNFSQDSYYNQVRDEYSYSRDRYVDNNDSELYYNDDDYPNQQYESEDIDERSVSSEKVIKRHFDKFKK